MWFRIQSLTALRLRDSLPGVVYIQTSVVPGGLNPYFMKYATAPPTCVRSTLMWQRYSSVSDCAELISGLIEIGDDTPVCCRSRQLLFAAQYVWNRSQSGIADFSFALCSTEGAGEY